MFKMILLNFHANNKLQKYKNDKRCNKNVIYKILCNNIGFRIKKLQIMVNFF